MQSHHPARPPDRAILYNNPYSADSNSLWDRLLQPSILIPCALLLLTVLYQSLHSSSQFSHVRHPGELLWDLVVTITPARLLYALDHWLHPPIFPVPSATLPPQSTTYAAKSDLLRRILSMDNPGGIMNAVAHAGKSISSLSHLATKRATDQPPGLGNYDNSCFQNSILQGLSSLKPLPMYLVSALGDASALDKENDPGSVATLRDLLSNLAGQQNNGTTLWTPKKLKSLDTWQQQDAQEYFSKILDEIDKEVTKVAMAQCRPSGLEIAGFRDDTMESQHSDDSGYQSLSALGKPSSEVRFPRNPLEGLIAQRVACVQCGYSDGLSMIPFNCITLSLGINQGMHDLYERLDSYTALESIDGVECAKCTLLKIQRLCTIIAARCKAAGDSEDALRESLARLAAVEEALDDEDFEERTLLDKCRISKQHRVSSTKTKQMVIGRPPSSLAIHINRSVFNENTGQMLKNPAAVRFPSILDLGPWCLGSAGSNPGASSPAPQDPEEQWSFDPKSSMISGDLKPSKISGPIFELRAVITHQGRHENGHYICYRKHPHQVDEVKDAPDDQDESNLEEQNEHDAEREERLELDNLDGDSKWWRLSDETVSEVTEEAVLAQGGVFMLFYDCVDPNPVSVSESQDDDPPNPRDGELAKDNNADRSNEAHNMEDEFHDTRTEFQVPGQPETTVPQASHPLSPIQATALEAGGQPKAYATSALFPLLKPNELVDPTIPLHWPDH